MDHEVGPWRMAFFHGLTSWSNFHGNKSIYKARGPFTRGKPNVDEEERLCTKNECASFLNIVCQKMTVLKENQNWSFSCLLLASLLFNYDILLFACFPPWISRSIIAMEERRRNLSCSQDYTCFCTCLWSMLWAFKHCFCKEIRRSLQFWA